MRSPPKLFIIAVLILVAGQIPASKAGPSEPVYGPPPGITEALADSLAHLGTFRMESAQPASVALPGFLKKALEKAQKTVFTSHHPLYVERTGKIHLRFQLILLTYPDPATAMAGAKSLLAGAHPDMGLTYAWDRVLATDNRIYWLQAPCLMSAQNWQRLQAALEIALESASGKSVRSFGCRCGGNCQPL